MEGLLNKYSAAMMEARKTRNEYATFLVATYSAMQQRAKEDGGRAITDADADAVLRSEIKGIDKALADLPAENPYTQVMRAKRDLLAAYIPKPLAGEALGFAIREAASEAHVDIEMKSMGAIMKVLNEKHPGLVDGAQVKALISAGV